MRRNRYGGSPFSSSAALPKHFQIIPLIGPPTTSLATRPLTHPPFPLPTYLSSSRWVERTLHGCVPTTHVTSALVLPSPSTSEPKVNNPQSPIHATKSVLLFEIHEQIRREGEEKAESTREEHERKHNSTYPCGHALPNATLPLLI